MTVEFPPPSVEQFFRTFRIGAFTVDAEERRLVFSSNMDGKVNLWALDMERRFPHPLTTIGEACGNILADPQGRYLIASFDKDGDENWQIYALPPEGGEPLPIRQAEGEKFFPVELSEDGRYVYYTTSAGNPMFLNSYRHDLETGEDELLHEGATAPTFLASAAREGDAFVTAETYSNTVVFAYLHRDGERIPLRRSGTAAEDLGRSSGTAAEGPGRSSGTAAEGLGRRSGAEDGAGPSGTGAPEEPTPHSVRAADFLDRDTVYFLTDEGDDVHYLARYDGATGRVAEVAKLEGQSMSGMLIHRESNTLYVLAMDGVVDRLYRYDVAADRLEELKLPYDNLFGAHVGKSGTLYVLGGSANVPHNISRRAPGGRWERLTDNRVLGVAPSTLRDAEVVTYESFDGLPIESLLFRPDPAKANGYTVFWPHGGPQAAERKFYRSLFQVLLAAGYNVFAPNFRGSTGYGTRFMKMVERDWGHGPRLDNVAGVEWLLEQGVAQRDKLFLVGGSYGGYMTLLLHGRHPEYWRACVDIFGPSNLFTFIESVPPHWKPIMDQWLGDPERDKERLTRDSPITYLEHMTKPMLVIQGANDPRVVQAESDQIVAALREQGTEVEYMVLEDEGHGFSRVENEIAVYRRMLEFLAKHQQ